MNKMTCKQILQIIDDVEINGIPIQELDHVLFQKLYDEKQYHQEQEVKDTIAFLLRHHLLKQSIAGIDLVPCAAIFVRSAHHSLTEALALFEFTLKISRYREIFFDISEHNEQMNANEIKQYLRDDYLYDMFMQTCFYQQRDNSYIIHPSLIEDIQTMITEYEENEVLLSTTLLARFARHLIFETGQHVELKPTVSPMIHYPKQDIILDILPYHGIPRDREITRGLQAFYKDTLFHEFDHHCPICGAAIPQMLIASHIRPFRECAHLFETIDYHNGLLLCKNHDFLFDQGYFSFLDNGHIIFSEELLEQDISHYLLQPDYVLPLRYQSPIRMRFLQYHLDHIFRK